MGCEIYHHNKMQRTNLHETQSSVHSKHVVLVIRLLGVFISEYQPLSEIYQLSSTVVDLSWSHAIAYPVL